MVSYFMVTRSHDSFTTGSDGILTAELGSKYASQRKVFDDLGQGVLDNAFEGVCHSTSLILTIKGVHCFIVILLFEKISY